MRSLVDKISVNIKIIGLNVEHNFLIPNEMCVADATGLIVQALCEEYSGVKNSMSNKRMLMQASSGKVLNQAYSLKQLGVVQGEKMILI